LKGDSLLRGGQGLLTCELSAGYVAKLAEACNGLRINNMQRPNRTVNTIETLSLQSTTEF
jgi:hypothetical protein